MRVILPELKWDKALDSIDFGGLGQWMADYERSLLPANTVFPRDGQIWETIRDCEVPFRALVSWPQPPFSKVMLSNGVIVPQWWTKDAPAFLPCGVGRLEKSERVRVKTEPEFPGFAGPKSIRAILMPLRYDELQDRSEERRVGKE